MSLESGKNRNRVAGLVILGLSAFAGFSTFSEKLRTDTSAKVKEVQLADDSEEPEIKRPIEQIQTDSGDKLGLVFVLPGKLPPLKGVQTALPQETLDRNKEFLTDLDERLHKPATELDRLSLTDDQRGALSCEDTIRSFQIDQTFGLMRDNASFWTKKFKLDSAYPNFTLVVQAEVDDLPSYTFVKKSGLVPNDFDKYITLDQWHIIENDGLFVLKGPLGSSEPFTDNGGDLMNRLEDSLKAQALRLKATEDLNPQEVDLE